jgi:hypothetical protein
MSDRLGRFGEHRFIGTRDDMRVYDCDEADQREAIRTRLDLEGLVGQGMVSTFGPDTLAEARNRGFSPQ